MPSIKITGFYSPHISRHFIYLQINCINGVFDFIKNFYFFAGI